MNDDTEAPGGAYREIIREQEERIDRLVFKLSQAQELITELCDALQMRVWPNENPRLERSIDRKHKELLQRAREATR